MRTHLDPSSQRALDLASAKGASNWLTTRPLQEQCFTLHKSAFHDAVALRYGWSPQRTPAHCACGTSFSVEHALSCPKSGLPSIRHNEIRDLTATLLTEVCSQVAVEPELQPVSQQDYPASANIQDGARLDIAMNGFWGGRSENVLWMCGCSTLWLLLMRPHHWPPVIGGTRTLRNVSMLREFVRRSMPLLPTW